MGGGNTSVKTQMQDLLGETHQVLCVKGSGWDMGSIEPPGLPAVKLEPLRKLRRLERLSDEDMVNFQRTNLLDSAAPNPSVETLLHAFLPGKFIDHTHAAAVLSLVDQPNGRELVEDVYNGSMGFVPYCIPGFGLAKLAAQVFEASPHIVGLILDKHGIFTFAETAREAYERMIAMVSRAEARLAKGRRNVFAAATSAATASVAEVAPIVRGAIAVRPSDKDAEPQRFVLDFRTGREVLNYVNGADLADYGQRGVVTPDHVIRTKNRPLIAPWPLAGKLDAFAQALRAVVADYIGAYDAMFQRENNRVGGSKRKLDPLPRVVLVPGLGLFGVGATPKDAAIAADLAGNAIQVITDAEAIGRFEPLPEADLFDVEYWSLEQAKLKANTPKAFTGQVAVVTGGAGGIGAATAKALAKEGAAVAVLDRAGAAATAIAKQVQGLGVACDVTDRHSVRAAFRTIVETFGGVDIVVSNAGAAWQGKIGAVADDALRQSFELNFFRASGRGAGSRGDYAQTGDRRRPAVQRLQAGRQSWSRLWSLRAPQGGNAGAHASVCSRLRQGGHPRQRGQRRSHPHGALDRRHDCHACRGPRRERGRLYGWQPAAARGDGTGRGRGLRLPCQGACYHGPHHHRRRRQHRRGLAIAWAAGARCAGAPMRRRQAGKLTAKNRAIGPGLLGDGRPRNASRPDRAPGVRTKFVR